MFTIDNLPKPMPRESSSSQTIGRVDSSVSIRISVPTLSSSKSVLLEAVAESNEGVASQISEAISNSDHEELTKILEVLPPDVRKALVNTPNENGDTPLLQCCFSGSVECMQCVLKAGANCLYKNSLGENFLHYASWFGRDEMLEAFLTIASKEQRAKLINAPDKDGYTPLLQCAKAESPNGKCVKILLDSGASPIRKTSESENFLHLAALEGNHEALEAFLTTVSKDNCKTLLNALDKDGDAPLFNCINSSSIECCKLLLTAGADLRRKNRNGENFAHVAARMDQPKLLEWFLQSISKEDLQVLVDARDKDGDRPLFSCCESGSVKCLDLILAAGASPSIKNDKGENFTHLAARLKLPELLESFFQKVPKALCKTLINTPDRGAALPLFHSCAKGDIESLKLLLETGADHLRLNHQGETAYEIALTNNQTQAANLLLQKDPKLEGIMATQLLGLVFGFEPNPPLLNKRVPHHGSYGHFIHSQVLKNLETPKVRREIFSFCSDEEYTELTTALAQTSVEYPPADEVAERIQSGQLVILPAGWGGHAVSLVFHNGYLVICNRGDGCDTLDGIDRTLVMRKIDLTQITDELVQKIIEGKQDFTKGKGRDFIYRELLSVLSAEEDDFCHAMRAISPKLSKAGVCSYASTKAAIRVALALITKKPQIAKAASKVWSTHHREVVLDYFQRAPSPYPLSYREKVLKQQTLKLKKHQDALSKKAPSK